jgi:hypothetical protein
MKQRTEVEMEFVSMKKNYVMLKEKSLLTITEKDQRYEQTVRSLN